MTKTPTKTSPKTTKNVTRETKKYKVVVEVNDQTFSFKTNDIGEALMSIKPFFIKTRVKIVVTEGKKTAERYLFVQEARRMWRSPIGMFATLKKLIFK